MIFKTYELRPAFSSSSPPTPDWGGDATRGLSYSIIVGTRKQTPTSRDREKVESAIRRAWEGLFDPQGWEKEFGRKLFAPPYGLAIVYDQSPPVGETEPPPFVYNGFYIIFALLETEKGSAVSEDEERATHEAIYQAISAQYSHTGVKPRIGLVTLYDCTVQLLEGPGPTDGREFVSPPGYPPVYPRGRGPRR